MAAINTQYFRYALEVEKTGSITQAANNLFMSQPTLSKAIKDMEETVGFPIFRRTSKGVVPTHRGTEFLAHARKIASEVQKMEQALQRQDTSHQLFSLAIPRVSYIAQAVADFMPTFNQCDKMEIDILEDNSIKVLNSVADGLFVLGIIRCHAEDRDYFLKSIADKDLQYETIWHGDYVALMREDHPLAQQEQVTLEQLSRERLVIYNQASPTRNLVLSMFRQQNLQPDVAFEVATDHMLASFVSQGLGVGIMPRMFGLRLYSVRPLYIADTETHRMLYMFRPKDRRVLPAVQRFWDFVLEVCAQYQSDE